MKKLLLAVVVLFCLISASTLSSSDLRTNGYSVESCRMDKTEAQKANWDRLKQRWSRTVNRLGRIWR